MGTTEKFRLFCYKKKWRKRNRHNNTYILNIPNCDISQISVGRETYGGFTVQNNSNERKLTIGSYCSIGENVQFLVCIDHPTDHVSTFPFKEMILQESCEACSKGDIVIDDDVWIGTNATILSGVHIGRGAVVGAGAVVTKDIPPYAVAAGVPAGIIKYRFEPEIIRKLMNIDYSRLDRETVRNCRESLYAVVKNENADELIRDLPKKSDEDFSS